MYPSTPGWRAHKRRPPRALPGELLTTHALKASDTPMPLRVLRYLDLCVLVLALPIFIAAGLPPLGGAGAAGGRGPPPGDHGPVGKRGRPAREPPPLPGPFSGGLN